MRVRDIKPGYFNSTSSFKSVKTGATVKAESTLEEDFFFLLDNSELVDWFEEQPLEISYQLPSENKVRTYTPDVLVRYKDIDGTLSFVLYEVKFRSELIKSWFKLKPKFKAAMKICKSRGWKFKVVTEKEIRIPLLKNLEFLFHFSRSLSPVEIAMRSAIFNALNILGSSTPSEVLAVIFHEPMKRAEALPILWRMIYERSIKADLNQPLNMNSKIELTKGFDDGE